MYGLWAGAWWWRRAGGQRHDSPSLPWAGRSTRRCLLPPGCASGHSSLLTPSDSCSYFHYSVPGGFTAPQAKDITQRKGLLGGGGGDPMYVVYARKA